MHGRNASHCNWEKFNRVTLQGEQCTCQFTLIYSLERNYKATQQLYLARVTHFSKIKKPLCPSKRNNLRCITTVIWVSYYNIGHYRQCITTTCTCKCYIKFLVFVQIYFCSCSSCFLSNNKALLEIFTYLKVHKLCNVWNSNEHLMQL